MGSIWWFVARSSAIVAFYLLVAVELTSLLRTRLPKSWWKGIHMSSYALFIFGTLHLLTAGTDRHSTVLLWTVSGLSFVIGALTLVRIVVARKPRPAHGDTIRTAQPIG